MGDAFVAIANDYNALFYNPAGLARREDGQVNLSIDAAGSPTFTKFGKDVDDATKVPENERVQAMNEALSKYYGKNFSLRAGLLEAVWVRPHWGVALIPADFTMNMVIQRGGFGPSVDVKSYLDTTLAYGYGEDIKGVDGRLSWGTTLKFVNRGFASKQILPVDLAADPNLMKTSDLQEGYTVDADIGFLYSPFLASEGFWSVFRLAKPTFGLVVRNVAETGFAQSLKLLNKLKTEAPEKLYRVLDVGMKYEYPNLWIFSGRGALDIRDIGHPNFSLRKGFHLGFEFDWRVASWWKGSYRLGVNQGYPTFGFSALFTMFNLDLVTYGEDVGTYDMAKENRMYLLKMSIDI